LQVLIGGPHAERAARQLLSHGHDLQGITNMPIMPIFELASVVSGLGQRKASQIKASFELGKRLFTLAEKPVRRSKHQPMLRISSCPIWHSLSKKKCEL